jgi:chromosomal replication initiator protein
LGILSGAPRALIHARFRHIFMMDGAAEKHDVAVFSFSGQGAFAQANLASGESVADGFVAGPENRLAAQAIAWTIARSERSYSPLVLCGPPGTGKSHLARTLASSCEGCLYTTAADFARELAEAIDAQTVGEFQARYRSAAMLVLEDLGQLSDKRAALLELQHTLDALEAREAQAIVTSHIAPAEIPALPRSLVSRFSGGLIVNLSAPAVAARRILLDRFLASRGVRLTANALQTLTEKLGGSVAQLQGAAIRLAAAVGASDQAAPIIVDLTTAKQFLDDRPRERRPDLREVGLTVAKFYGLKVTMLVSSSRRRQVVLARSVAIYLGRLLSGASLAALGRHFGGRDHTTALHSCRSIERRLPRDAQLRGAVGTLQRILSAA